MLRTIVGSAVAVLVIAGCGGDVSDLPLVQTEEEAVASDVQTFLTRALEGNVFKACVADNAGARDDVCVDLVQRAREIDLASTEVVVDVSLVQMSDAGAGHVVPRAAVTVPEAAADWLSNVTRFTIAGPTGRYVEIGVG